MQECLTAKFGKDVERKNKSIKVHGNTYRKDADTVPCIRFRDYRHDYINDPNNFIGGIVIHADDGTRIINFPEQHIAMYEKNSDTNSYYKKMVRIIKNMRYLMEENYYVSAQNVSSFGLESLLWNIPDEIYLKHTTYGFALYEIIYYLINHIPEINQYKEANGIKKLCPTQTDIEYYNKFIIDLSNFYEYDI